MTEEELANRLKKYFPSSTEKLIARWIIRNEVHFRVTQPRNSKFGDYRQPHKGEGHMITVNGNLNPWAFLITTIHEFAHLLAWIKYKDQIAPHGKEWKEQYKILLLPLIKLKIFPEDIEVALRKYIKNPTASSCSDDDLLKALKRYDVEKLPFLEDIPFGCYFRFNEKVFCKGKKQRTRYTCREVETGAEYMISGLAEVKLVDNYFTFTS